jgi:hypothetical protein
VNWALTLIAGPANGAAAEPVGEVPLGISASRQTRSAMGASDTLSANAPEDTLIPEASSTRLESFRE